MNDYIIKYPSYPEGAILKSCVKDVFIDKGNTIVIGRDGRVFDCHPLTRAVGIPDDAERKIKEEDLGIDSLYLEGIVVYHQPLYPVRWKLTKWEIEEAKKAHSQLGHALRLLEENPIITEQTT